MKKIIENWFAVWCVMLAVALCDLWTLPELNVGSGFILVFLFGLVMLIRGFIKF